MTDTDKMVEWVEGLIQSYDQGGEAIEQWFLNRRQEGATPELGICYNIEVLVGVEALHSFKDFLKAKGHDPNYPVDGWAEYQDNDILWWGDDYPQPAHEKRIELLRGFLTYLRFEQNVHN